MIATGPYWWYVNIGSVNGLVPSRNKQLSKPMSTRTEFNIAIWCHQDTFCGIMTSYNDIDLVQIGSGNEWLVAWRRQACSALSHYLNKLKGRWFETSWRPCCVTVKTMLQNAISILQMIKSAVRECGGKLCYYPGRAVEQTVEWMVIGNIMTLMWRHCNNNAISILQMITSAVRECGGLIGSGDGLSPVRY